MVTYNLIYEARLRKAICVSAIKKIKEEPHAFKKAMFENSACSVHKPWGIVHF
jgi:hypothetical protein